jgi:hypothetical protein
MKKLNHQLTRIHPGECHAHVGHESRCLPSAEEEYFLASFTRRLIKIAAVAGAHGGTSAVMCLIRCSCPRSHSIGADLSPNDNIKIKDKRLFVRNLETRAFLDAALDELTSPVKSLLADSPIIVQRLDKSLVILRIWPLEGVAHSPEQELQALVTLNLLGPPRAFRLRHDPGRLAS